LTFSEVVAKSSNIGMIKLSKEFPGNTLFRYLKNFGFGSATGVGLDGEESGQIDHPNQWSGLSKASLAIGYGLNATTVQLAAAYCAIINGGNLYRPYVIDRLEDEQGEVISESKSEVIRQVISPEVSNELKYYMSLVVKDGTGKAAKVNGVEVGGKTGTARKIKSTGGYYDNKYISSFAGFAPYDHPKYFCLIVVEEPGNGMIYGGDVSAPVFSKVISRIINLQEETEMPEEEIDKILVEAESDLPPLQGLTQTNAVKLLQARDVDYKITGAGEFVEKITHEDDEVILHLGNAPNRSQQVPRFVGLTVREALTRIDFSRYKVQLQGKRAGIVRNQSPAPGLKIRGKTQIVLTCN
jgi:membrane peptidoglycan carboxypeptidase